MPHINFTAKMIPLLSIVFDTRSIQKHQCNHQTNFFLRTITFRQISMIRYFTVNQNFSTRQMGSKRNSRKHQTIRETEKCPPPPYDLSVLGNKKTASFWWYTPVDNWSFCAGQMSNVDFDSFSTCSSIRPWEVRKEKSQFNIGVLSFSGICESPAYNLLQIY